MYLEALKSWEYANLVINDLKPCSENNFFVLFATRVFLLTLLIEAH